MPSLTFIGQPDATQAQQEYLMVLGAALALDSVTLITKRNGAANEAIIRGHEIRGGVPDTTSNPLTTPSQGLLVFGDSSFTELMDEKAPGWRDLDPTVVFPEELHSYVMAALAGLKAKELATEHIEVTAA